MWRMVIDTVIMARGRDKERQTWNG